MQAKVLLATGALACFIAVGCRTTESSDRGELRNAVLYDVHQLAQALLFESGSGQGGVSVIHAPPQPPVVHRYHFGWRDIPDAVFDASHRGAGFGKDEYRVKVEGASVAKGFGKASIRFVTKGGSYVQVD